MSSTPFQSTTLAPRVEFTRRFVQPPAGRYISPNDKLYILSYCAGASVNLSIRARILDPNGETKRLDYTHTTSAAARSSSFEDFTLQEGFLLSVGVFNLDTVLPAGLCYVQVGLIRGTVTLDSFLDTLAAGYLEALGSVSYPQGRIMGLLEGPAGLNFASGTGPAAGADILEQVPSGAYRKLKSVRATLTCSGVAGSRHVRLRTYDSTLAGYADYISSASQGAGSVRTYFWTPYGAPAVVIGSNEQIPIPPDLTLPESFYFGTVTSGLLAGDQWSVPTFTYEERMFD